MSLVAPSDPWLQRAFDLHNAVSVLHREWAAQGYVIESEPCLLGPTTLEPTYVFYRPSCSLRTLVVVPNVASRTNLIVHSVAAAGAQHLVLLVRLENTAKILRTSPSADCAKHPQGCGKALGVEISVRAIDELLGHTLCEDVGLS